MLVLNRLGLPGGLSRRQVEDALKVKVDVTIPDLPKQVHAAATLGKPAAEARGAFREAILSLSRQVAASRLIDSADQGDETVAPAKSILARLLGRKK